MPIFTFTGKNYRVCLHADAHSACLDGGFFGGITIAASSLFSADVLMPDGTCLSISSDGDWGSLQHDTDGRNLRILFSDHKKLPGLSVVIMAESNERGISWSGEISNNTVGASVIHFYYPMPQMEAEHFKLFVPGCCGEVRDNRKHSSYTRTAKYPNSQACMQYYAVYDEHGGIYLGLHDGKATPKIFFEKIDGRAVSIGARMVAPNATRSQNSFHIAGYSRWQAFDGDWYDATMIYADFVRREATWLPPLTDGVRKNIPARFADIPFWVIDYIPNSERQGDNKPMVLSAGSEFGSSGWVDDVIRLQRELGVPIAYHVYNWHEIPFNIEYPHFLPAKECFRENVAKLQKNAVLVVPYTNAVCWEENDHEGGHAVTFQNDGIQGASLDPNGDHYTEHYPQKTISGKTSHLVPMCPQSSIWHDTIRALADNIYQSLDVDGIYYDQIAATPTYPCYNPAHGHPLGGGSYWVDGYNKLLAEIKEAHPDRYSISECNAEPYMKNLDGFLTWMWGKYGEVPAFPAVYSRYIQNIGRFVDGHKRDDDEYFIYSIAQELLYGQVIGWCKSYVLNDPKRLAFLRRAVGIRYHYTEYFRDGILLRPPHVLCDIPVRSTQAGQTWYRDPIEMPAVLSGAWQAPNGKKILIVVNATEQKTDFALCFDRLEYGVEADDPRFEIRGTVCTMHDTAEPLAINVLEL